MKLVYIYGPPGVGKLTVAKELAALTGFALFHNHLSIDCVLPVFSFDDEGFWPAVHRIRLAVIEEAAHQGRDIIFTNVYEHPTDLTKVQARIDAVERHGGEVCLVQLTCDVDELLRRIEEPGRQEFGKLSSAASLRRSLAVEQLMEPIPGRLSLRIDNTDVSAGDAAREIEEHYGLRVLN